MKVKKIMGLCALIFLMNIRGHAQLQKSPPRFESGDYDELKISCDSITKSFTIIVDSQEGNSSCTLFLSGKMVEDKNGKYPIKAYPYGLLDNTPYNGTLFFRATHHGGVEIQLSETGSCQNIIDFKRGVFFPLDKVHSYRKFSMVKTTKAPAYSSNSIFSNKKGYLIQGDFVSIISERDNFVYVEYVKKPTFKAWLNRSDLVL